MWYNIEKCIKSVMVTSQYLFPQQIAYDDIENFKDIQDSLVQWMYHYICHLLLSLLITTNALRLNYN